MSRFADPLAREKIDLGPCECPGSPHESDYAMLRKDLSSSDVRRAVALDGMTDTEIAAGLVEFIPEWNLLGPNGEPWPPSADSIIALKYQTLSDLISGLATIVAAAVQAPNGSGALSTESSRESASRTPKRNRTPGT